MGQLKANSKEVVHEQRGDIVVINTCGFIDNAKEESINTILDFVETKNRGEVEKYSLQVVFQKDINRFNQRNSRCRPIFWD